MRNNKEQPRKTESPILTAARSYLERGWQPVPIPHGSKAPNQRDWQRLNVTPEDVALLFHDARLNIGVRLGRDSGGLVDVDLDCPEALTLAADFLPPTDAVFGRAAKPKAHWLYTSDLCETEQQAAIQYEEPPALGGATLVELRIGGGDKGAQTIFPPSQHPGGERIEWDSDGEVHQVEGAELKQYVAALAAGALLVRHYPTAPTADAGGVRHTAALVLGGLLARAGWSAEEIAWFVERVAIAANDEEVDDRVEAARSAVEQLAAGGTPGLPRMREVWGAAVADTFVKWLGISSHRSGAASEDERINAQIAELARLAGLDYERRRGEVAEELGVRRGALDRAVEEHRQAHKRSAEAAPPPPDIAQLEMLSSEIIEAEDVLSLFVSDIAHQLAGEVNVAKMLYLAATSRLFGKAMHTAIKGPSSAGKSEIRQRVLQYFPPESVIEFTALSEKALLYMSDDFKHKVLSMGEALTSKEVEFQDYLLRELMSAGRLRYPVVQKIDGQLITTTIEKEGPVAFMVTTTRNKLNHENETRMLSLEVDDSEAQTRAVLAKVALVEGRNQRGKAVDFQPWHDFQRWLAAGECNVVVKFSLTLASLIPPRAVRLRRDFSQLLLAIKAHALLHRHHRKRDVDGAIVATIGEDYAAVRDLMSDLLAITADTACSEAVLETIKAVRKCQPLLEGGGGIREIAEMLKIDRTAAWRRLRSAIDAGYVVNLKQGKRGASGEYRTTGELPPDPDEFLPSVEDLRVELRRRRKALRP